MSAEQRALADAGLTSRIFLHGRAGCGKTAVGVGRLRYLIANRIPAASILVLTPQRTLHDPYLSLARSPAWGNGSGIEAFTVGGLAHRLCDLFWPLVAQDAGFAEPTRPPFFLTLESSQYYMSHLVRPLLDLGYFRSVTMDRNRLYAQILDSLNKSAAVGFPYTEIGERLDAAWVGDVAQRRVYAEAQECATRFREYCLRHNLLDFSLQMEVFWKYLWPAPVVREYLIRSFRHLIYDNVEEDVPRAHDLIQQWLPHMDSALLIYDEYAGYRGFLGADTQSGWDLGRLCSSEATLEDSFVMSIPMQRAEVEMEAAIRNPSPEAPGRRKTSIHPVASNPVRFLHGKFFPQMLDSVCNMIHSLTDAELIPPSEIAILGPYLSDALRFALMIRLEALGVPVRTHRPSRSLRDEPSANAMLTLAALAHPHWNAPPPAFDVARLFLAVLGMDLVRAHLLTEIVFRQGFTLLPLEELNPDAQERITPNFGARYSQLRGWLLDYREGQPQPLDHFFRRIFGEVLSQSGFGFHDRMDQARVVGSLVESVTKFRLAMEPSLLDKDNSDFDVGREYIRMLQEGVLASQYLASWRQDVGSAVLIAPAYSFLMMNRPVAFQFWLDPGSSGWFERLDQPLTHTRVLSRSWPRDKRWDLAEEQRENTDAMARMTSGLMRRCSRQVFACTSQVGESGFEQRGTLLRALQQVFHESEIRAAN